MKLVKNVSNHPITVTVATGYAGRQPFYERDKSKRSIQLNPGAVRSIRGEFANHPHFLAAIAAGDLEVLREVADHA